MNPARRRIEITEHSATVERLSERELSLLVIAAGSTLEVSPLPEPGYFSVRAGSHVGVVLTDDIEVLIQPKIPLDSVFLLLEPARVPLDLRSDTVGFGTHEELTPAFAAFYARMLELTIRRGLRRDYRRVEERLVTLRGRLDTTRQIRTPVLTPLACVYDEYTEDTPMNRLLKAAAVRLLRLEAVGTANRDALRHILMWFGEVGDRPPPVQQLLKRGFSRLDAHYEPAVRLAALVLEGSSLRDDFGATAAHGFLIDMNRVFETFLEERLRVALAGQLEVRGQDRRFLDIDHQVRMRPDLVFAHEGLPVYVGDAKYKVTASTTGYESDLYQLLAYTTALGVPEGVLVYAQADGEVPPNEVRVAGGTGKRLAIARIDLRGGAHDIRGAVSELSDWIASRARMSASGPVGLGRRTG